MTVIPFPTSVKTADVRAGTNATHNAGLRVPARPSACKTCGDEGFLTGCGTNNPSERARTIECPDCNGGYRNMPCSPHCYCWCPLDNFPDGSPATGLCVKDECPEPIRSGVGFSAWREWLR